MRGVAVQAVGDVESISNNGFVHTLAEAWVKHRAVILRPNDVWLAILAQFSLYVDKHAGELREAFAVPEGEREAIVYNLGTRYSVDFGNMASRMSSVLDQLVTCRETRDCSRLQWAGFWLESGR